MHKLWGDFGFTLILATFWTLAFEIPILNLEKMMFNKNMKSDANQKVIESNIELEQPTLIGTRVNKDNE